MRKGHVRPKDGRGPSVEKNGGKSTEGGSVCEYPPKR
jgi:hypothetical protein